MAEPNYESRWWGYIYDQMMTQHLQDVLDSHLQFYQTNLLDVNGPVLDCACGTGLFLLPLLVAGHDMYGFDISPSMLARLKTKAEAQGIVDIDRRVSVQNFVSFRYEQQFDAVIIPTNTFLMLTTQEAQITTLKNIHAHLASGGKLLLDRMRQASVSAAISSDFSAILGALYRACVADKLRAKRKGQAPRSWHVDETYIKVSGVWKYLYRAIDRQGNLVDSRLSEHRDMDAAKRFFTGALEIAEQAPEKMTTDGHDSYPRAIRETLGEEVTHRCNPYLNNRIEQDHRGVKQRYYAMRGFGNFDAASRFCRTFDEQRHYFRLRLGMRQRLLPLSEQRREHRARFQALMRESMAA